MNLNRPSIRQSLIAFLLFCSFLLTFPSLARAQSRTPYLRKQGAATQLIVDGRPFLVLGGELGNSSSSMAGLAFSASSSIVIVENAAALCAFAGENFSLKRTEMNYIRLFALIVLSCSLYATVNAQSLMTKVPADQPAPRLDENSKLAHKDLLEKAKQGRIDVYFEGDSITRRWGTSDEQYKHLLENWRQNFFGWNAADFAWGGDTTQNVLWRLHNGELDHVNPKVIVLLAGTNNVGSIPPEADPDPRAEDIARGIKAIVDLCRSKAPKATIILMGIFPRNDNMAVMSTINQINERIAKFADGKKIRYLNINDKLADKHGRLFEGMTNSDGLHLDLKGYQMWADALKPILTELLGPPAKEDHAPPPTGDPSQKRPPAN